MLEDKDLILPLPTVSSILTEFIRAGRPLDTVIAYLEKSSLTPSTRNSLLFFACVDNRDEERAASVLQVCMYVHVHVAKASVIMS